MTAIEQRLDKLEERIGQPAFRGMTGRANEVNQWVFDYAPQDELIVRQRIEAIRSRNARGLHPFALAVFDIYDIMMEYLESRRGFVEKTAAFEKKGGFGQVKKALRNTLRMTEGQRNKIVEYIAEHTPDQAVVFLTGIGKCHPILEAQEIFNKVLYNMPDEFASVPMVLFYPGKYTEQELKLFGELEEGAGYYRAFRIIREEDE